MDVPVADQLVAAAEDTGMAEPGTEVVVPQVGVCVEVDDVQVRVLLHGGPHGTHTIDTAETLGIGTQSRRPLGGITRPPRAGSWWSRPSISWICCVIF